MDTKLKIVVPQEFITINGEFKLKEFVDYLQTDKSIMNFEYEYESKEAKSLKNWFKNIVDITKWYLK